MTDEESAQKKFEKTPQEHSQWTLHERITRIKESQTMGLCALDAASRKMSEQAFMRAPASFFVTWSGQLLRRRRPRLRDIFSLIICDILFFRCIIWIPGKVVVVDCYSLNPGNDLSADASTAAAAAASSSRLWC